MNEPRWIGRKECVVIHEMMLARHGGMAGIRDEALLAAALARPQERFAAKGGHLAELAAAYAAAIAITQPFLSGNAPTAFLLAVTFLRVNGLVFTGAEISATQETLALARSASTESFYALFLKCNSRAA